MFYLVAAAVRSPVGLWGLQRRFNSYGTALRGLPPLKAHQPVTDVCLLPGFQNKDHFSPRWTVCRGRGWNWTARPRQRHSDNFGAKFQSCWGDCQVWWPFCEPFDCRRVRAVIGLSFRSSSTARSSDSSVKGPGPEPASGLRGKDDWKDHLIDNTALLTDG